MNFQSNMKPTSDSLQWKKNSKMVTFKLFWAIFRKGLLRNSSLNHYILNTIFFITVKDLLVFCRSCLNTGTLEIFHLLEHFSCWLSAPHFAKLYGSSQIQDIHWMKELFYKIFVLNNSVFCTFSFFVSFRFVRNEAVLFSVQRWTIYIVICNIQSE